MSKSVKSRFVGRYGSREQALATLHDDNTSYYDAGFAVKNPNLTLEDLLHIATTKEAPVAYYRNHAHNEYFNRTGVMVDQKEAIRKRLGIPDPNQKT